MIKRAYGWKRNPITRTIPKYRDSKFFKAVSLPPVVDLRSIDSPILDQGQLGACTGFGITGCINFIQKGFLGSAIFLYYNERKREGTIDIDSGANISDGILSVQTEGICPASIWPNDDTQFTVQPSQLAYDSALKDLVTDYLALESLEDIKTNLANGFPFVFGIEVFESFESEEVSNTGIVPVPANGEQDLGGHCMKGVGYDDNNQWVIVANSWNTLWGKSGYCFIPYSYFLQYGADFGAILKDSGE